MRGSNARCAQRDTGDGAKRTRMVARARGREVKPRTAARAVTGDVTLQRDLEPVLADLSDLSNLPEKEARQRAREILDRLEDFQPSASSLSGVMELAMADGVAPKPAKNWRTRRSPTNAAQKFRRNVPSMDFMTGQSFTQNAGGQKIRL